MKKLISLIMVLSLILGLCACNDAKKTAKKEPTKAVENQVGLFEGDFEKPDTRNTANFYNIMNGQSLSTQYDDVSEELRLKVVNSKSVVKAKGETRYISYRGSDENDGLTPETPWKTYDKLLGLQVDTVLFERGGVYRGTLDLMSDTSYGAYGEGPKPAFYTGPQDFADPDLWKNANPTGEFPEASNVWAVRVGNVTDIGNVIFNHGEALALKVINTYKNLTTDYQFYHNRDNGVLYVYCSKGNPGELFDSIEIAVGHGLRAVLEDSKNIVVDNLCVKYSGQHGISFMTGADNVKITNCEIGWIGGSITTYGRLGNGIEFVNAYSNATVENCWIYQCYDAGYTFQNCAEHNTTPINTEHNMVLSNTLIEYCNYNVEIFGPNNGLITDSKFENNILRFGGFGWGSINRIGSNDSAAGNMILYKGTNNMPLNAKNFVITNNIFDTALRMLVSCPYPNTENGPTITGNTYNQQPGEKAVTAKVANKNATLIPFYIDYGCATQAELEASVKKVDTAPKAITLQKK